MLLVEPMQKMRKRDRERTVGCKRTNKHQKKKSNIVLVKMLLKHTVSQK